MSMGTATSFSWKRYRRRFREPLRTGRGVFFAREGIVLRTEERGKGAGYGEIAPWEGFGGESLDEAESFLRAFRGDAAIPKHFPLVRGAFAMAQEMARAADDAPAMPPWRCAALLPAAEEDTPPSLAVKRALGFDTFKLKIAASRFPDEACRVRTLLDTLLPGERLRLDANGALDSLTPWLPLMEDDRVEFLEQPFPPDRMARENFAVLPPALAAKLALDESVSGAASLPENWLGVVVVKPLLLGDWGAFRRWRRAMPECPVVYSSSFETAAGRETALRLMAEDPAARTLAHGFDTLGTFEADGWEAHAGGASLAPLRWSRPKWEAWWQAL
ncbi:MAG: o-succinylbenzoate synthase [Puniceicoccales bacterium]|jgi:O-succinylbenzoate synthase|nr:o-succinylbenzoate synthase [Puniceicoccales bacterium]